MTVKYTKTEIDNHIIIPIFRAANEIVPDMALHITSCQLRRDNELHANTVGLMFPSKYGMRYFSNDDDGLVTGYLERLIDDVTK